jgi:hypothetical protein
MRSIPPEQITLFKSDWLDGLMIVDLCQRHTLSRDQVVRLRVRLELPPRLERRGRPRKEEQETPTREEIDLRAAEIRSDWTPEIERKRRGLDGSPEFYEIPRDVESPPDFDPRWYD